MDIRILQTIGHHQPVKTFPQRTRELLVKVALVTQPLLQVLELLPSVPLTIIKVWHSLRYPWLSLAQTSIVLRDCIHHLQIHSQVAAVTVVAFVKVNKLIQNVVELLRLV